MMISHSEERTKLSKSRLEKKTLDPKQSNAFSSMDVTEGK